MKLLLAFLVATASLPSSCSLGQAEAEPELTHETITFEHIDEYDRAQLELLLNSPFMQGVAQGE